MKTEMSFEQRYAAAMAEWQEVGEGRPHLPERTPEERATRELGTTEIIALTMLENDLHVHSGLWGTVAAWITGTINDPGYIGDDSTDEFRRWSDGSRNMNLNALGLTDTTGAEDPIASLVSRQRSLLLCSATLDLLGSIWRHRRQGIDGQESTTSLGFGIAITTSLEAAVATYHSGILWAWTHPESVLRFQAEDIINGV